MRNWKIPILIFPLSCLALFIVNTNQYQAGNIIPDIVGVLSILLIVISTIWLLNSFSWKGFKLDISEKSRNWKVPAIILVLLILSMAFRWGTIGSKTDNSTIYKYKIDHWNGSVYKQQLTPSSFRESLIRKPYLNMDWYYSKGLTIIWCIVTGIDIIWLLYAVNKVKNKEVNINSSIL